MTEMSGADMVVQALVDLGVDTVFGYPGGAVLPIYDALYKHPTIKHILVRHEQAATHAAEGYARSTGKPGVVLVTSGPGATNAVTGITDALLDSIPMVVLTGQVPTTLIGTDAFQECDTVGITRHCTKHNYLVMDPDRLGAIMHEAFYIATNGRPGPVVIDIPKNVQVATGIYSVPEMIEHKSYRPQVEPDADAITSAVAMIAAAERPIFYTGGGVINAGPDASAALRQLVALPCSGTTQPHIRGVPWSGPLWRALSRRSRDVGPLIDIVRRHRGGSHASPLRDRHACPHARRTDRRPGVGATARCAVRVVPRRRHARASGRHRQRHGRLPRGRGTACP